MATLGKYELLDEIGRGGMGVVRRGRDPIIGRDVAIKVLRLSQVDDPAEKAALQQRLLREGRSAGVLSHAGIVTIYEVVHEGDSAYIVMEYVNGPSLEKVLARPEAPDQEFVIEIIRQTAAALDYAHKRGIVHRDVKPSNLLLTEDSHVKIADFGLAKISSSPKMTQTGAALGTPYYMAPEQIQGLPVDPCTDQYALGVVTYQMLTGLRPFTADTMTALFFKIVYTEPAPASSLNPTIGPAIEKVLGRALSKNQKDRFPSCSEFAAAFREASVKTPGWCPRPSRAAEPPEPAVEESASEAAGAEPRASQSTSSSTSPLPPSDALAGNLDLIEQRVTVAGGALTAGMKTFANLCTARVRQIWASLARLQPAYRYAILVATAVALVALVAGGIWSFNPASPKRTAAPKSVPAQPQAVEVSKPVVTAPPPPPDVRPAKTENEGVQKAAPLPEPVKPRPSRRRQQPEESTAQAEPPAQPVAEPAEVKPEEPLDLLGTPVRQTPRKRTVLK